MKIRPFIIYIVLFVIVIVVIVMIDSNDTNTNNPKITEDINRNGTVMPQDSIHKGLTAPGSAAPSESNVKKSVFEKMKKMEEAVKNNPNDTLKIKEYAEFMAAAHQPEKAIIYYNKILQKDPKRIDILLDLTSIYFGLKKFSEAEKVTNNILKINPKNSAANYNLGVLKAVEGKKEEARKIWQSVISKYPNTNAARMAKNSLEKL